MTKRYVKDLRQVYAQLVADAIDTYPTLEDGLRLDLDRLHRIVEERGIHAYCVDLPAVGKHLDRCLAEGAYAPASGLPFTRRANPQTVLPRFLGGLYRLIFEDTGQLKEDYHVEAIIFLRQILYLAKRTKLPHSRESEFLEIEEFIQTDSELPEPLGVWEDSEKADGSTLGTLYQGFSKELRYKITMLERASALTSRGDDLTACLQILDIVSGILVTSLGSYDPYEWPCKHGPGAISQTKGPSNKYHWYGWDDRLESVYPIADFGYHSHSAWVASCFSTELHDRRKSFYPSAKRLWNEEYLSCSRLEAVPKTLTKPRLIAVEPSERQWCQQSLRHFLYDRFDTTLIHKFVRIRDQTWNQDLCRRGSKDGSLATVDLSAASDRLSCMAVGNLFRQNIGVLQALIATRTSHCIVTRKSPEGLQQTQMRLRKFATMGNACTFPVETLMFLSVALASVLTARNMRVTRRNIESLTGQVAVYGDDIIIPVDSRALLCDVLEILDFKVNDAKSFWTGRFRESCGLDSFNGVTVTPVYYSQPLDRSEPESIASTIDVRNHFYGRWYLRTAAYLASTIPESTKVLPVHVDSGVSGLHTRVRPICSELVVRWNWNLHRCEALTGALNAHSRKVSHTDDAALFQYFTERPSPHTMWRNGVMQRPTTRWVRRWASLYDLYLDWGEGR